MSNIDTERIRNLLLTLWEAEGKPHVKAWAIHVALTYAINRDPGINKRDIWQMIQNEYVAHLHEQFPEQREPGQSYRRESGAAWEMFVEEYLNSNLVLRKEGIRAVNLSGADLERLMASLRVDVRPKDVDLFLQGVDSNGAPVVFGALFPKASYAERIRADEGTSRKLMEAGLWSGTVTLDVRQELGSEQHPSVKRRTIQEGGFHACYSFNERTEPGPKIHIVQCTVRGMQNPLVRDIVRAWRAKDS